MTTFKGAGMEWTDRQDPTSFIFESIESSTMLGTEPIPKTLLAIPYKTPSADTRALETNSSPSFMLLATTQAMDSYGWETPPCDPCPLRSERSSGDSYFFKEP